MNPARLVFPGLRWGERASADVWPEVRRNIELGVGGFVVFGGSVGKMRELVARAQEYAGRPLLFAADLERGAGQQFEDATPLPPAAALAGVPDEELLEGARITAQEAASAGVGWVLAPVADLDIEPSNPIVATRSFGASAASVSDLIRSWVIAAQAEGVNVCVKHFPGHGRTTTDSHAELPLVRASREELEKDLAPFKSAIEAGVRSVMMAHVSYSALDPSLAPASLSPTIIGLLRDELGFSGLIATDVVLYPSSPQDTIRALVAALDSGRLSPKRVADAAYRIVTAAAVVETLEDDVAPAASYARALELAGSSLRLVRGSLPPTRRGQRFRLHIVDDDVVSLPATIAAPGSALAARGRLADALRTRGAHVAPASSAQAAIDVVAVFSDVRGWKGRAFLAPETIAEAHRVLKGNREAVVVLFGHPRLAEQLPFADNLLCAWCGDPLMQDAAAQRLMATARR
jgi:beta-glucosidase